MASSPVAAYLARLGVDPGAPTLERLIALHRAHLATVPYDNLGIMVGRPPSVDPADCLERAGDRRRTLGYCFHHNAALERVLLELGHDVRRHGGHVWSRREDRLGADLNHLVVEVAGLPTPEHPGGRWWVDAGLGDGFRDPLPLVAGEHRQAGASYRLEVDGGEERWTLLHDPSGSFTGVDVGGLAVDQDAVDAAHHRLSRGDDSPFRRVLVVARRDATGWTVLRGCVLSRFGASAATRDLTDWPAWRAALVDLGAGLDEVGGADLRALFERSLEAHHAWVAAGRP